MNSQPFRQSLIIAERRPEKHLTETLRATTARQFCRAFIGVRQVAWATVTSGGQPRVAPVDAVFIHGRFYLSTDRSAFRTRNVRRNPATSLTYLEGITFAVIVHGSAKIVESGGQFQHARNEFVRHYGREMMESVEKGLVFIQNRSQDHVHSQSNVDPRDFPLRTLS